MAETEQFAFTLELADGYRFRVDFDQPGVQPLWLDEPQPLGEETGPNASRLLAAAVGNCLSASLLYCLRRAHVEISGLRTRVAGTLQRNDAGRLRIAGLSVRIEPVVGLEDQPRIGRCLELFEDFCVVTASVREGIPVDVQVETVSGGPADA